MSIETTDWYANARAVYRANSLDALIHQMSKPQQHQFKRAIVEMALWYLEPLSEDEWDPHYRERTIEVARAFLAAQTREAIDAAVAAARRIHLDVDGEGYPDELIHVLDDYSSNLATAISGAWALTRAARHIRGDATSAMGAAARESWATYQAVGSIFKRRQIEAAQAILRGGDVSLAHPVSQSEIEAARADAAWMYRDGNLASLVDLLNDEQSIRFKQAVVGQGITAVEAALTTEDHGERALLDAARRWIDQPDDQHTEAVQSLIASFPDHRYDQNRDYVYEAAYYTAWAVTQSDAYEAARKALSAVNMLNPVWDDWELPSDDWDPPPVPTQWQIEAAWAILHNRKPPPIRVR